MLDIGLFEIVLISVVSLVVLGPDKLPGAIRTVSLWIGRLRRSFNNIKNDIEKEIGADEIRRQLRNEAIMEKFDKTKTQFTKTIDSVKEQTDAVKKDLNLDNSVADFKDSISTTSNDTEKVTESAAEQSPELETSSTTPKTDSPSTTENTEKAVASNTDTEQK